MAFSSLKAGEAAACGVGITASPCRAVPKGIHNFTPWLAKHPLWPQHGQVRPPEAPVAAVVWEPEASARGFVGNGHGAKAALAWAAACAHLLAHLCRVARSLEPILDACAEICHNPLAHARVRGKFWNMANGLRRPGATQRLDLLHHSNA
eukprot:CAMPEP_0174283098 /NCGR_PEP_ID=MMETSP0809-20121228/3717_1 /TAXON_ID=73025 ORGANISM="Eutreptiella gymnastica-like, Strain CCMP1594" /NCGR_SAMPLE_ID=MMETSP0809 /ASSEMBLY_ACC=CAM_ASM_000658 /LENGTH=149 /DNA_ID=CAMNT_0015377771 /DNA_START=711 /DNA_END=1161 /DNA_ORIENTATION=-